MSTPGPSPPIASNPASPRSPAPGLPNNVDLLTFELGKVDGLLARVASFTLISGGGAAAGSRPIEVDGHPAGLALQLSLHRLEVVLEEPNPATGVRAGQHMSSSAVAELTAELRWIPDGFVAAPGFRPPATAFDPGRGQRFVVLDGRLSFHGGGHRRVELFGTGRTFPAAGDTGRLRLGAAMNVVRGQGPFQGLPGMMALNGLLEPSGELSAALLLRVLDPSGRLTAGSWPASGNLTEPPPTGTSFLLAKGENDFSHSTALIHGFDGGILGADLHQTLRQVELRSTSGRRGLGAHMSVGQKAATMNATMWFDPTEPPPVSLATERGIFTFVDGGGAAVGWLEANIAEGRGFPTPVPGAPTPLLRGVGLAPILRGSGCFAGVQGLVTVANWISIFPRQVSSIFLMRVDDPDGRFRAPARSGS